MSTNVFYTAKRLACHKHWCNTRFVLKLYNYNINKVGIKYSCKFGNKRFSLKIVFCNVNI